MVTNFCDSPHKISMCSSATSDVRKLESSAWIQMRLKYFRLQNLQRRLGCAEMVIDSVELHAIIKTAQFEQLQESQAHGPQRLVDDAM
jgi:hypothetical protein